MRESTLRTGKVKLARETTLPALPLFLSLALHLRQSWYLCSLFHVLDVIGNVFLQNESVKTLWKQQMQQKEQDVSWNDNYCVYLVYLDLEFGKLQVVSSLKASFLASESIRSMKIFLSCFNKLPSPRKHTNSKFYF